MNIGFLGLGKLGLPVALAVESKGHNVFGTDINELTLKNIRFKTLNYIRIRNYLLYIFYLYFRII